MSDHPIRGKTLRFTFDDGPMAGKAFDHAFDREGNVTFRAAGANGGGTKGEPAVKYESAKVREDVWAVSYRSSAGYTLTTILDLRTKKLVAFASNDKMLSAQSGSFEEAPAADAPRREAAQPHEGRR
jgi:hypothetical protein